MLTLRDHRSGDLFDPWEYLGPQRRRLLERSWTGVFREHLLTHLPVGELAAGLCAGMGRPTKDLDVAIGALILQQLHDLTDEQTVEAIALNIAWHYLVQLMETFVEDNDEEASGQEVAKPDLITHVAVGKMTVHDRSAVEPALEDTEQRGVKPTELLADSHYGSNECLRQGAEYGVKIVSPSMPPKGKQQGKLTLEDFELDDEGWIKCCPEGQSPVGWRESEQDLRLGEHAAVAHQDHA